MQRRGNTHRNVLLWDGHAAIIGSFNWGSFRGDPRRRVREEIGVQVTTPREVSDLEGEYRRIFSTSSLA
jgi:prepilin-type processing-associated H-X9-DG protein